MHSIVANDLDAAAVDAISKNVKFNFLEVELTKNSDEGNQKAPPVLLSHADAK